MLIGSITREKEIFIGCRLKSGLSIGCISWILGANCHPRINPTINMIIPSIRPVFQFIEPIIIDNHCAIFGLDRIIVHTKTVDFTALTGQKNPFDFMVE